MQPTPSPLAKRPTRRQILQAVGATLTLAGCGGGTDSVLSSTSPTDTTTPATPTPAAQQPVVIPAGTVGPVTDGVAPVISGSTRCRPPSASGRRAPVALDVRCSRDRHSAPFRTRMPRAVWFSGGVPNDGSLAKTGKLAHNGGPVRLRAAWLTASKTAAGGAAGTDTVGAGLNQSALTLTPMTFLAMRAAPGFAEAGGLVSADGLTCTMPPGWMIWSDPLTDLALHGDYFIQSEFQLDASFGDGRYWCSSMVQDGRFGDARGGSTDLVHSANWSTVSGAALAPVPGRQFGCGPLHVTGLGPAGAAVLAVDGDSIIAETTSGVGTSAAPLQIDLGLDSRGAAAFAKRALQAAGYAWFDLSVAGLRLADMQAIPEWYQLHAPILQHCAAVLTDLGHNDRNTTAGLDDPTGAGTLMAWHNDRLRSLIRPGGRVVRTTLCPATTSTDRWTTLTGQAPRTPAQAPGGLQDALNARIRATGVKPKGATIAAGAADAYFDLNAACADAATGFWRVNGTPDWPTHDGTHPALVLHRAAAATLQPALPALLGF